MLVRLQPAVSETAAAVTEERPPPQPAEEIAPTVASPAQPEPAPSSPPSGRVAGLPPSPAQEGIEFPLVPDPTYYPARLLDVYPQPLTPVVLDYPDTALAAQVDGRVLLLLLIDESGKVTDSSVVEADPAGYFEDAAHAAFRATRFAPGLMQGRPVKCRVLVQVRYSYGDQSGAVR